MYMWFYIEYYIELQKHDLVYNGINIVMVDYTKKTGYCTISQNMMKQNDIEHVRTYTICK